MGHDVSDDLAHAIVALAKASAEIGVVFRSFVDQLDEETKSRHETNRILAGIFDQNGHILSRLETFATQTRDSERKVRVLESTVQTHVEYLVKVGKATGIPAPEYQPGRYSAADR